MVYESSQLRLCARGTVVMSNKDSYSFLQHVYGAQLYCSSKYITSVRNIYLCLIFVSEGSVAL